MNQKAWLMFRCSHNFFLILSINNIVMCKRYFLIISSFIIICSSCSHKDVYLFDEEAKDLKEFIEWTINYDSDNIVVKNYRPVSSKTLSDIVSLDNEGISITHNKGTIIAVLYFNDNEAFINKNQKDLLILVSKSQIFEDFNILIESNNIKPIMPGVTDKIIENLLSNGVKSNYINLNYLSASNKKLIIKLIKLL